MDIVDKLSKGTIKTWEWSWRTVGNIWNGWPQHKKVGAIIIVTGIVLGVLVSILLVNRVIGSFLAGIVAGLGIQMFMGDQKNEQKDALGSDIDAC